MANITIQQVTKENLPKLKGPLAVLTKEGLSILKYPSNLGNKADSNEKNHWVTFRIFDIEPAGFKSASEGLADTTQNNTVIGLNTGSAALAAAATLDKPRRATTPKRTPGTFETRLGRRWRRRKGRNVATNSVPCRAPASAALWGVRRTSKGRRAIRVLQDVTTTLTESSRRARLASPGHTARTPARRLRSPVSRAWPDPSARRVRLPRHRVSRRRTSRFSCPSRTRWASTSGISPPKARQRWETFARRRW